MQPLRPGTVWFFYFVFELISSQNGGQIPIPLLKRRGGDLPAKGEIYSKIKFKAGSFKLIKKESSLIFFIAKEL